MSGRALWRGLAIAVALVTAGGMVHAQKVSGTPSALIVDTDGKTVGEVLKAMSAKSILVYRTAQPLDRRLQGTYRGSLEYLVPEILAEYDFIIGVAQGKMEVRISGLSESRAQAQTFPARMPSPAPAAGEGPAPEGSAPAPAAPRLTAEDHKKIFGADAPHVQMSDAYVNAYAARALRGNTRRNPGAFPTLGASSDSPAPADGGAQ